MRARSVLMLLTDIPLFASLSNQTKARVEASCTLHEYSAGQVILSEGNAGDFLYAIADGIVSVQPTGRSGTEIVLGRGEVFGEMSLLGGAPVSASITAVGD